MGVPGELRQVFANLLANSLDAIADNGTIKLHVSRSTCMVSGIPHVRVTIADDGKGIDPATLPRIFEPLFTTKEATGSGLGLWVSKQIIDKHQGSIRLRSRTSGNHRGTAVSVLLPANSTAARRSAAAGAC
jgi:signal transduction histidine kinase